MSGSNPPDRTDRLLAGNRAHDTAGEQIPHSTRPAPQLVRPSRSAAKLGERTMAAPKPKKQKTAKRPGRRLSVLGYRSTRVPDLASPSHARQFKLRQSAGLFIDARILWTEIRQSSAHGRFCVARLS
jgi:hypothetical protein